MPTVREFVQQSYELISAHNPTTPLHGNDLSKGITILNQLLQTYASTGLLITVAAQTSVPVTAGQTTVVCGPASYTPTPDIALGRLANLDSAWLELDGVTYPLIDESRNDYFAAWKYEPLQGLPRFIIVLPDIQIVNLRLYPAPSQAYTFNIRGKFQLTSLSSNDDMDLVPQYYHLYLTYALARQVAKFKGRNEAWTPDLEAMYQELMDAMVATSEINVSIDQERQSLLNGAWRVRAGI